VRDVATGKVVCRINLADECVLHLGYSPDGRTLVVGSRDEPLRLLDASTGKVLHTLGEKPTIGKSFSGAAFSPDGKILAEFGCRQWEEPAADGTVQRSEQFVRLWNVASGREVRRWDSPVGSYHTRAAFSPDGRFIAATEYSGAIFVWDTTTGKEVRRIAGPERVGVSPSYTSALAWAPDGKALASAHWDTTILLWEVSDLPGR
jgi:WD40 repeat protein